MLVFEVNLINELDLIVSACDNLSKIQAILGSYSNFIIIRCSGHMYDVSNSVELSSFDQCSVADSDHSDITFKLTTNEYILVKRQEE
jgi:hypothetical protein